MSSANQNVMYRGTCQLADRGSVLKLLVNRLPDFRRQDSQSRFGTGGKPSTWFTPEGLAGSAENRNFPKCSSPPLSSLSSRSSLLLPFCYFVSFSLFSLLFLFICFFSCLYSPFSFSSLSLFSQLSLSFSLPLALISCLICFSVNEQF